MMSENKFDQKQKNNRKPITLDMTAAAYLEAKAVYHGEKQKKDALDYLENDIGMNRGSASDFVRNFKKLMDGEQYERTNNAEQTEYLFEKIVNDYGLDRLSNALNSASLHVKYYESLPKKNKLNKITEIIERYKLKLNLLNEKLYPDEVLDSENFVEGTKKSITVNAYERNQEARQKCIAHYGTKCSVCEMDFEEKYGKKGKGFIHVHHLVPLHKIGEKYKVDPINDLRPVCPNCHAMLHRQDPQLTIEELKNFMSE